MKKEVKNKINLLKSKKIPLDYIKASNIIRPNDWKFGNISDFMDIRNNLRLPISEEQRKEIQGIYPYYGPTKVQDYIDRFTVDGEHVLIGEDGDNFLKYKEKEMTLLIDGKFNVNNHAHILRGTARCTTKWFYYYFLHKNIYNSLTRQGAGRYKLTKESLMKMKMAIPPIQEQLKITTILSTWDKAIELKTQLIEEKKQQKKGLAKKLLTGEVRLPGFDGEWKYIQARKLFQNISDKGHNGLGHVLSANQERGIILRSEGNIDIKYDKNNLKNYKKVQPGEFVISLRSFQGGIEYSKYEGLLSPAYTIIRNIVPIDDSFYKHFFKSTDFITRLNGMIYGIRDGKQISFKDFAVLKLPYTTLEEQIAIGKVLECSSVEIGLLEQELTALKLQKKGLMQLLLTGIVRVPC